MVEPAPGRDRRWPRRLALVLGLMIVIFLLLTNSQPWVPQRPAATAQQVEAARSAFRTARKGRALGQPSELVLNASDLDSISTMVSQGFAPKRLDLRILRGAFVATASQPFLGRWLNIRVEAASHSQGFPALRTRVGVMPVPASLSRLGIEIARQILSLRGVRLPALDMMVRSTNVAEDHVEARIFLPKTGLIDRVVPDQTLQIDEAAVSRIYCDLASQQRAAPAALFATQLQRALGAAEATPAEHGAALVALAMFVTDPRVGELVGDTLTKVQDCLVPAIGTTLQGRSDSPKHWSLSAALTVAAGGHLAVTMGEWKELADSLSQSAYLAHNDRSGFSFVDLATDRAGFFAARQLTSLSSLEAARGRLLIAKDEQLLPASATRLNDGMNNADFVRRFGGTDDPRFLAALNAIDDKLRKAGLN